MDKRGHDAPFAAVTRGSSTPPRHRCLRFFPRSGVANTISLRKYTCAPTHIRTCSFYCTRCVPHECPEPHEESTWPPSVRTLTDRKTGRQNGPDRSSEIHIIIYAMHLVQAYLGRYSVRACVCPTTALRWTGTVSDRNFLCVLCIHIYFFCPSPNS